MHSFVYFIFFLLIQLPSLSGDEVQSPQTVKETEIPLPPSLQGADVPEVQHEDRFFSQFLNMLFTLGLIVFALLTLSWILKRMTNTRLKQENEVSTIKILERRSITPRTAIYVLEIKNKVITIAESHNNLIKLSEFDSEEN